MKKIFTPLICLIFVGILLALGLNLRVSAVKDRYHYETTGEIMWEIKTEEKVVALTFDDGPHPKHTAEILDILSNYDAKATFFVVGENAEKNSDLILRQYNEGHEIANHTYTHPLKTTLAKLEKELKQTDEIIFSITGTYPELFRPVEGQYSDQMIQSVVKKGYRVIMWSWHQDTEDWKNPGIHRIEKTVLKGVKPGNIILFHDGGGNRRQTVEALEKIIPELKEQGYEFVTVSELIKMKHVQTK
ncbi:polysaccharide deacetylase family protein [Psychrobacillus sp. OK032]|uniref:polysaccharide deacetylase family protein n=1 Tax=Psychrobacillus sp. OK032 TaxID=1884358 RepID=UPI0008D3060B|nr:polysaccharide deacetylase family protein [Psychrobacillus sp. OK032]SER81576.1 polysaccharide deacetylase family sporulation protein PdaB [Psychrobacillus sp. OK032]